MKIATHFSLLARAAHACACCCCSTEAPSLAVWTRQVSRLSTAASAPTIPRRFARYWRSHQPPPAGCARSDQFLELVGYQWPPAGQAQPSTLGGHRAAGRIRRPAGSCPRRTLRASPRATASGHRLTLNRPITRYGKPSRRRSSGYTMPKLKPAASTTCWRAWCASSPARFARAPGGSSCWTRRPPETGPPSVHPSTAAATSS